MSISDPIITQKNEENKELQYIKLYKCLRFIEKDGKKLSPLAQILYSDLIDKVSLSEKNRDKYTDNEGNLFIIHSLERVKQEFDISDKTATKAFKELVEFDLIVQKRKGARKGSGNPYLIYVKPLQNMELVKSTSTEVVKNTSTEVGDFTTDPYLSFNQPNNNQTKTTTTKGNFPKENSLSPPDKNYYNWIRIATTNFPNSILEYAVKRFCWSYKRTFREEHPILKDQQLERCLSVLNDFFCTNDIDSFDDVDKIIDSYFKSNFPTSDSDYHFNHFCSTEILQRRYYEAIR
ncbi:MAG: replication initiator protein A [Candidatus Paceibacterota bacterium]